MTISSGTDSYKAILQAACEVVGLDARGAELMRLGENVLYRLRGGMVARIARPGQQSAAAKEVRVAQWMAEHDIPAIQPVTQPVVIANRAVTIWHELPRHRRGSYIEVAAALRRLHAVPPPEWIPTLTPFVRTATRIQQATTITEDDRTWLLQHLADLQHRYSELPTGLPHAVIHGDAYGGNIVVCEDTGTPTMLDLERVAVGPPEWDLTSTAVHLSFQWISKDDYAAFCRTYGYDVTTWDGYTLLRDIRELRITTWIAQLAVDQPDRYRDEAALRVACLRGRNGPRPWAWTAA